LKKIGLYAPGLAFISKVSLSTLGVVEYFHVLQCSLRFSFLGFWDERVVTVRKIYTECNAEFSCVIDYLSYPTLVGHIHLNKN
jgi:hypothetical protein